MSSTKTSQRALLPSVLFLGDRSPYGLSIARALELSRFTLRGVVIPSERAHERLAQRARRRRDQVSQAPLAAAFQLLRRALGAARRTAVDAARRGATPVARPAPRLVLDPGITVVELEGSCRSAGADWLKVDTVRSVELYEQVQALAPEIILSAAFPMVLDDRLLSVPRRGAINFHPSLLPRCRGSHPIFWTLAADEPQGGVTAHFMTREVDTGNIVAQIPLPLSDADDYGSLYNRAMDESGRLVSLVQDFLLSNGGAGVPQDARLATAFREDTDDDHRIAWHARSAGQITALVRTGMAYAVWRHHRLNVLKAAVAQPARETAERASRPGEVLRVGREGVVVAASPGAVVVTTILWRDQAYDAGELARFLGLRAGRRLACAPDEAAPQRRLLSAGVRQ